ncbi:MAG TPA: transposase [Vicinamibacterales bacterium]|nr:transposase [Vicinamibacterales bacterium]
MLYQVVRDHYERFAAQAAAWRDGQGLPPFIDKEFRGFLRCGWLGGGFARFRCDGCGLDRLVPFSCKGRAVCPSCSGRRMAERSAHLIDHVFPDVPVRQWVLTVPLRQRYLLAWNHGLTRAVVGVFMRGVLGWLRRRARVAQGIPDGRGGAVAIVQRFGAALNVNVHTHALVLDGVFAEDGRGRLVFHPAPPPGTEGLEILVAALARRIHRLLVRRRVLVADGESDASDPWVDDEPVLAGLTAASVQGRVALGSRAGAGIRRCGALRDEAPLPAVRGPYHAACRGFDLDATVQVPAGARDHLERVCRYALRPPIAQDRIQLTPEGDVLLELRHRWSDGTTHLRFHPLELLERLASLTPRPRINLVLYYGVVAAHAAWRARLPRPRDAVATPAPGVRADPGQGAGPMMASLLDGARRPASVVDSTRPMRPRSNWLWAQLMQRTFGFDVLACPRCGGRFRLIALIEHTEAVRRILHHLGLPTEAPPPPPARAPPRRPEARNAERDFDTA